MKRAFFPLKAKNDAMVYTRHIVKFTQVFLQFLPTLVCKREISASK